MIVPTYLTKDRPESNGTNKVALTISHNYTHLTEAPKQNETIASFSLYFDYISFESITIFDKTFFASKENSSVGTVQSCTESVTLRMFLPLYLIATNTMQQSETSNHRNART